MTYLTAWILAAGFLVQHPHMSGGMDFDQDATVHHFRLDTALRDMVRAHLRTLPQDFAAGDFAKPFATHGETPDGVPDLIRLKDDITYSFETLKQGGRVRIRAASPGALDAVHAFLRYQIREHHTGDPTTIAK